MNIRIIATLPLLILLTACGGKVYRPNLKQGDKKAFVIIDGSKAKKSAIIFGSKKTSILGVNEFPEKCAYRWLGDILVKSAKSSKAMPVKAGQVTGFLFIREYETKTSGTMTMPPSINVSSKKFVAHLIPKPDHTYVFEFDDKEKGFTNFKVYEEGKGSRKEITQFLDDPNAACEKVKEVK